jgi:hypothetical protein
LISELLKLVPVSRWFPDFQQSMNFPSAFGNGSDRKPWLKRVSIYCVTRRVVATRICAKHLPLTYAILEAHAVIQIKS